MRISALVALLLFVPAGNSQENQDHPGYPPTILLASATEVGGKVVIQLSRPGPVPPSVDGKVKPGDRFKTEWVPLRKVTLGETVQAFAVDGKPVEPKAVLKVLAKPKGVGVFMRNYANDPVTPPAFYRDLFREGSLLLVANPGDLYNPKP
jgi:hypothetical protein